MKKLLLTEGLLACFFLALLIGFFGKYLGREREGQETNANVSTEEKREKGEGRNDVIIMLLKFLKDTESLSF